MKAYIDFCPGEACLEKNRAWQGCPTIARTRGGRLFAGWYSGGAFEPCIDNFNLLIMSDDNGETWSKPILTVSSDYENCMRNIDIQLWVDPMNRLWVMWTRSPYAKDCAPSTIRTEIDWSKIHREFVGVECLLCKDPDAEELCWEEPRILFEPGFLRCKPVVLKNGTYVFPAYDWVRQDRYYLHFSADCGDSFYDVPASEKIGPQTFDETMLYEYGDRLRYLVRTIGHGISFADSYDGGKTWSETAEFQPAPSSRFYVGWLKCGLLALVRNVSSGNDRTGMKICLSEDGGATFPWELVLDSRENVSYPDLCEDDDGNIFILHDRERDNRNKLDRETWISGAAKEILLSKVTVKDILSGCPGEGSYLSRVISKALVDYVEK